MSTPKRRKKNGHDSSPATTRSLDFYFSLASKASGQQQDLQSNTQSTDDPDPSATGEEVTSSLTDEALALKLQKEWNEEPAAVMATPAPEVSTQIFVADEAPSDLAERVKEEKAPPELEVPVEPIPKATLSLQSSSTVLNTVIIKVPFDESPLTFDPSVYLSDIRKESMIHGGATSYGLLVRCFVLVNSTQSRIKIVDTLVNLLRTIIEGDPESLQPAV